MATWDEQWNRVQRSFAEFKKTEDGRTHDRESNYYKDGMLHFFMDCYHLKDWLTNDPTTSTSCADVEMAVTNSLALSLCADIANATKHLTLTRSRSGDPSTSVGAQHARVGFGDERGPSIMVTWEVLSGNSTWDAFNIAQASMDDWRKYLRSKTLIP